MKVKDSMKTLLISKLGKLNYMTWIELKKMIDKILKTHGISKVYKKFHIIIQAFKYKLNKKECLYIQV